ncbi:MAG: carboxymuconolactone decarboxylase family protein [Hyphomonas sp.]|nr:carboxymuconolactone decarboxylase family protein [Hyphomonas sp.]
MTAVKTKPSSAAPDKVSKALNELQDKLGYVPNIYSTFAGVPVAFDGLIALNSSFSQSSFTPAEQEIIALTTSVFNQCPYCVAGHSTFALQHGVDAQTVSAIRDGSVSPEPRYQALGRTTRALMESKGQISRSDTALFLNGGYEFSQLLELLLGIAGKTMTNFASKLAHVPLDSAFREQEWAPAELKTQL